MNIVVGTQPVAHAPGPVVAAFMIAYSTSVPFTLSPGIESALPKKVKNFSQNPPHGNAVGHLQVAEALLDAGGTLTPGHRNHALLRAAIHGHTACCELMRQRR
jgi:hypothetical protein